jgi:hypothetical protein
MDGELLQKNEKNVALRHGQSIRHLSIDFQAQIASYGAPELLLRVEHIDDTEVLSEQTVLFTAPERLIFERDRLVSIADGTKFF